ncbi:MAG: hypothetical protein RMZ69_21590 [Nostoc sp. ChiQUE01a]|nr:hypothetical protein [Nostoc sp. ChiQUE01a]
MSQAAITRGKEIIKNAIRETPRGEVARIPVADEANLAVFQQALRQHDIQRMLLQKGVSVEFNIPESPVEQAKNHMLQVIRSASAEIQQIVFPVLPQDYADAEIALASAEVQQALNRRNLTASLTRVPQKSEIVIATYDQVMSGELNRYLREIEDDTK